MTLHRVLNYGSVLQTLATCHVLRQMGHRPIVVDYITYRHQFWPMILGNKGQHGLLLRILLSLLVLPRFAISRLRFNRFLRRFVPTTSLRYGSMEDLQRQPPAAEVYLTGSDQVWNAVYNGGVDAAYFLDFGTAQTRRVSYAASFGRAELHASETERTRALLARYQRIGVRESSAVAICATVGRSDAAHVLDPTLLLTGSQWRSLMPVERREPRRRPYVLVHGVNERACIAELHRCAALVAKKHNCDVVSTAAFSANLANRAVDAVFGWHRSTEDFLRLIAHAEVVVADSFHGTVFSILFGRRFVTLLPPRYATRITSLLNLLGLEDRIVGAHADLLVQAWSDIDYARVDQRLADARAASLVFLRNAVG